MPLTPNGPDPAATTPGPLPVPDRVEVLVPLGGRVLVFGDVHLGVPATASSEQVAGELARVITAAAGPGVVVVAGDLFELVARPGTDVDGVLRAHPRLRDALVSYAADPDHRLVVLPGAHDGALAWDPAARRSAEIDLGATVALAADLVVATGAGERRVRVEPGHQLDPANAFADPRNPAESPLGHHLVRDLLPAAQRSGDRWLEGVDHVVDPAEVREFVRSRLLYRRVARRIGVLLVPFLVSLACLGGWVAAGRPSGDAWLTAAEFTALAGVGVLAIVALGGLWWGWAMRGSAAALGAGVTGGPDGPRADDRNHEARQRGVGLVGDGFRGFVSAHTQAPELVDLGGGFYANVGSAGEVVERRDGRLGLPDAYAVGRRISWLELAAGPELTAQLRWGRQALPSTTSLERLATRPIIGGGPKPAVVGQWPDGPSWPEPAGDPFERRTRIRRQAAALLGVLGVIDLLSAITPPLVGNIRLLTDAMPIEVPQTAASLVVLAGISLLLLSRGVRRGQRHAWLLAVLVLSISALLHLAKGLDVAESVSSLGLAAYLFSNRVHFRARVDEPSARRGLVTLAVGVLTVVAAGLLAVLVFSREDRPSVGDAFAGVAQRMVGLSSIALPHDVDRFLQPTLLTATIGLAAAAGWLLFRPVVSATVDPRPPEALEAARRIVARGKGDTLAYFALREDKRFFFHRDSLVAYAVMNGVALVSPDPLGPTADRRAVWDAFVAFADDHGWPVAVMGAGEDWLDIYRASGMHDVYVGDEAVVDVRRFDLAGGRNKGLRQAVNRVGKKGYRTEFHDPASIDPALEAKLRALMTESRRGDVERGFSMTLGRIFDPADRDLLLTVCFGPDGEPAAFCQFVPAPAIHGYSLDLMRRSESEHPNGLTDFVVAETIRHLRETGHVGLGLNFAVMRAVLAGERGDGNLPRIQRWFLKQLGDSMQIESLWRFNAKFDPDWVPRYAVYGAYEHFITAALAVAKAESFWELPVIGRFLKPKADPATTLPARPDPPASSAPEMAAVGPTLAATADLDAAEPGPPTPNHPPASRAG